MLLGLIKPPLLIIITSTYHIPPASDLIYSSHSIFIYIIFQKLLLPLLLFLREQGDLGLEMRGEEGGAILVHR